METSADPFNCPTCGAHDYGLYLATAGGCIHCIKARLEQAEVLLYGCLVKFSNDDENNPYDVYHRAHEFLKLPGRMAELKEKFLRLSDSAGKSNE